MTNRRNHPIPTASDDSTPAHTRFSLLETAIDNGFWTSALSMLNEPAPIGFPPLNVHGLNLLMLVAHGEEVTNQDGQQQQVSPIAQNVALLLLQRHPALLQGQDRFGKTIFHHIAHGGDVTLFREAHRIVQQEDDWESLLRPDEDGATPLMIAATCGHWTRCCPCPTHACKTTMATPLSCGLYDVVLTLRRSPA